MGVLSRLEVVGDVSRSALGGHIGVRCAASRSVSATDGGSGCVRYGLALLAAAKIRCFCIS